MFCFDLARLATRVDDQGVLVPSEDQERSRWDRALVERGVQHLARSATGGHMSRWPLEAGIASEHAIAPSLEATDWDGILARAPSPWPAARPSERRTSAGSNLSKRPSDRGRIWFRPFVVLLKLSPRTRRGGASSSARSDSSPHDPHEQENDHE
jgi:hypothetical protein